MKKYIVVFAVTLIFGFSTTTQAAYPHEGEDDTPNFIEAYPDLKGTKLDNCALCHCGGEYEKKPGVFIEVGSCQWCHMTYGYDGSGTIGETMNPFGTDYKNAGRNADAFASIEEDDSDGDSYTNKQEIDALSYPGDENDDPTKIPAPRVTYTLNDLESLTPHTQFLLMNTSRSGDFYAEYQGVTLLDLLRDAGMIEETTAAVTVYAPDGYYYTYELKPGGEYYYIDGTYPQAQFYYDTEADMANEGWCDYSAPSCIGRNNGDLITVEGGLKLILAYKRDGAYLDSGELNEENKLDGEGPFRAVPPQMVPGPPDQSSTAENQDVIWPYDEDADHNAGFSARTVVAIRVEPLPEGTTDFNWYEGGWGYVDDKEVIVYGNLESGGIQGLVTDQTTNQPIENATITTDKGDYFTITDESGSFSLIGMKVDTYSVRASASGYRSSSQSVTVAKDEIKTINFSLTRGITPPPCPIESIVEDKESLSLFRSYRDTILLQSTLGRQYVESYYEHAAEIVRLMLSHSGIREKLVATLKAVKPSIENMMQGNPLIITKTQVRTIGALAKELKEVGSSNLKKTICQFEKDLHDRTLNEELL